MRVAFSVWNDRISPVFDVSRRLEVMDIEEGQVLSSREEEFASEEPARKVARLSDLEVHTLVCGAISRPLADLALTSGIELIPFIAGEVGQVVEAYLCGQLPCPDLTMPGCCGTHGRFQPRYCERWKGHRVNRAGDEVPSRERRRAMPRGDGTGPQGKGPGTGRGAGKCGGGAKRQAGSQGQRAGVGKGQGQGRKGRGNKGNG